MKEVLDVINLLQNKSSGPYSIPFKLLMLIPDLLIIPLAHIINVKIVKVIPIHKGGSTQEVNNFPPISLLSIFDKIMEKIMHKKLYHFLEENNILFKKQFGFKKNNLTVYALIDLMEKIKKSIDNGLYGCGIFIDLRKAFDTVNHDILLMKLQHYGIRNNMLSWFKSYLTDREQFVSLNGAKFRNAGNKLWCPSSSVLGTLLFLLYINDLPNISKAYLLMIPTCIMNRNHGLTSKKLLTKS